MLVVIYTNQCTGLLVIKLYTQVDAVLVVLTQVDAVLAVLYSSRCSASGDMWQVAGVACRPAIYYLPQVEPPTLPI